MRGSEGLHCVLASADVRDVQQRAAQPLAEQALAGRGGAVVQGAHQAACPTSLTALQYLYSRVGDVSSMSSNATWVPANLLAHVWHTGLDYAELLQKLPGGESVRQAWARKQAMESRRGVREGES